MPVRNSLANERTMKELDLGCSRCAQLADLIAYLEPASGSEESALEVWALWGSSQIPYGDEATSIVVEGGALSAEGGSFVGADVALQARGLRRCGEWREASEAGEARLFMADLELVNA